MATAACTGLTDAQGYVIAVRRDCGKGELTCADVCGKTPRDAGINIVSPLSTESCWKSRFHKAPGWVGEGVFLYYENTDNSKKFSKKRKERKRYMSTNLYSSHKHIFIKNTYLQTQTRGPVLGPASTLFTSIGTGKRLRSTTQTLLVLERFVKPWKKFNILSFSLVWACHLQIQHLQRDWLRPKLLLLQQVVEILILSVIS